MNKKNTNRLDPTIGLKKGKKKKDLLGDVVKSIDKGLEEMESIGSKVFTVIDIKVEDIIPSKKNFFNVNEIDDLATDIEENGLSHNLLVRPAGKDKYEIISGERRFLALKKLGNLTAPCKVAEELKDNDIDSEIVLINTNAKTRQLSDIEKAKVIEKLEILYKKKKKQGIKVKGRIRENIAKDMGVSGEQVEILKRLNKLIPGLKKAVTNKEISTTAVDYFSSMEDKEQKLILGLIKKGETVDIKKAKVLKEQIESSAEIMQGEMAKLDIEKKKAEKELKNITNKIAKTKPDNKLNEADLKAIEDNAKITIATNMLSEIFKNKNVNITKSNQKELQKLQKNISIFVSV